MPKSCKQWLEMRSFRFIQTQVDCPTFHSLTLPVWYDQNWQPCTKGPESSSKLGLTSFLSITCDLCTYIHQAISVLCCYGNKFTRRSLGSTRSLLLLTPLSLIAAGGRFCSTSPRDLALAEVRLGEHLWLPSEGRKVEESHIRCTFFTEVTQVTPSLASQRL